MFAKKKSATKAIMSSNMNIIMGSRVVVSIAMTSAT